MASLPNPRHERFTQALAEGKTADEAYVCAGYQPNRGNASTLKANQIIAHRVAELQNKKAEAAMIDRAWVLKGLVENVKRAMQQIPVLDSSGKSTGEYRYDGAVANKALELIGKELGMFVDRLENSNVHYHVSERPMSVEEWAERHCVIEDGR